MSADKKPRLLNDQRDMLLSLAPLVVVCLVLAGLLGQCTFSLAGPDKAASEVRDVDAARSLGEAARYLPFPVRALPAPKGWRAISVDRGEVKGSGRSAPPQPPAGWAEQIAVNYLSPGGRAFRVTQTVAQPSALRSWLGVRDGEERGEQVVGETRWRVIGQGELTAWIWDAAQARVSLSATGGKEEDFHTLAGAVGVAPVAAGLAG